MQWQLPHLTNDYYLADDVSSPLLCSVVVPVQVALKLFTTPGFVNEILAFTQNICCSDVHDA